MQLTFLGFGAFRRFATPSSPQEDLQLSMEEKDRKARLSAASLAAELAEEGSMEEPQVTAEEPAETLTC
jgi:hypothetical protein